MHYSTNGIARRLRSDSNVSKCKLRLEMDEYRKYFRVIGMYFYGGDFLMKLGGLEP